MKTKAQILESFDLLVEKESKIDTYSIEAVKQKLKDGDWEVDGTVKAGEKVKVVDKKDGGQTGTIMIKESIESDELILFIDNDSTMYNKYTVPVQKALSKKFKAGKYDHKLSLKSWARVVDAGAKAYAKEFAQASDWNKIFSVSDRKAATAEMADNWKDELDAGNLHEENLDEELSFSDVKKIIDMVDKASNNLFRMKKDAPSAQAKKLFDKAVKDIDSGLNALKKLEPLV